MENENILNTDEAFDVTLPEAEAEYEAKSEYDAEPDEEITHKPEIDVGGEISALESEFPGVNLSGDTERYLELRTLGLSPREAYFASASRSYKFDTRSHLTSAMPKRATSPTGSMSVREMAEARELFPGLSDRQIENLYKSVNK